MTSPTARSLTYLRREGWEAYVVEKWVPAGIPCPLCRWPKGGHRIDAFGFGDVLAIRQGEPPLMVQACAGSSHAARRSKILSVPGAGLWLSTGGRIEIMSWAKRGERGKRKLWTLRREAVTADAWTVAEECLP